MSAIQFICCGNDGDQNNMVSAMRTIAVEAAAAIAEIIVTERSDSWLFIDCFVVVRASRCESMFICYNNLDRSNST